MGFKSQTKMLSRQIGIYLTISCLIFNLHIGAALAGPSGHDVQYGNVTVHYNGNNTIVNITSNKAIINWVYYQQGLKQEEIAIRLKVSRASISLILAEARRSGIVEITIRNPLEATRSFPARCAPSPALRAAWWCRLPSGRATSSST